MKYLEKIIEYGLYLLIFLLPIQARWIIKAGDFEYSAISLYGTDIALIFLLIFFVVYKFSIFNFQFSNKPKILNSKFQIDNYWWAVAGLELFVFISIFFAPDKLIAIYAYLKFLLGVGLFWLVLKANYDRVKLIFSFILGASLQALLGIWQFLFQSDFQSKWLGKAIHEAGVLGTSVVETLSGERFLRAYGGLDHPNMLGGFLVIAILVLILFLINSNNRVNSNDQETITPPILRAGKQISKSKFPPASTSEAGRAISNQFQNPNFKLLLTSHFSLLTFYFPLLALAVGLFFTFSRAAWVGLVAGLAVALFLSVIKKDLINQKIILKSILTIGIVVFVLYIQYGDLAKARISSDMRLEIKSNTERLETIENSFVIIKKNIFFGTGTGNYTMELSKINKNLPSYYYQPVHNVYLLVLAEIGIFGFLFFIGFFVFTFYFLLQKFKEEKDAIFKISVLVAMCIMFLFDHWWWSLHFGGLMFWLTSGLMLKEE